MKEEKLSVDIYVAVFSYYKNSSATGDSLIFVEQKQSTSFSLKCLL